MLVFRLPNENGVQIRPKLARMRFVFASRLFFSTLKYGLSTSFAALVSRRRVPAGVIQSCALSFDGQARRPMSGPLSPLNVWSLLALVYCIDRSARRLPVTCAPEAPVRLMRSYCEFGTTPPCFARVVATR